MSQNTKATCKIGPSILSADLSQLADVCNNMMDNGADFLHLDVMDGHFVPNMTFGHPIVKCLRKHVPNAFFDMHMMVDNPQNWVEDMASSGATQYTFHYEATEDVDGCIRKIREAGMKVGMGIKPGTPVEVFDQYIEKIDMALIMTVEPGFGGQKFMGDMMPKIEYLRKKYQELDIEVDGGVSPNTIDQCANAGANMIVSGTAVVYADDPRQVMNKLRDVCNEKLSRY
ncbi:DgyrCDS2655 [Dimorphilus gyrociliatus]|uniref:Ribulose-phosphate 3-epimerase n=1 Tax=Dimorphilus gyrociliatus TaxID=2664684 RepID=A0A7I8VC83_9ANNE|nr:DgyrCDS2655 [Dimorphilus gyrociliatus]